MTVAKQITERYHARPTWWILLENDVREDVMEKKVLDAMKTAGKPVKAGEVAEMIGEDSKAVSKAIKTLKESGKIISPKRCYYAPK